MLLVQALLVVKEQQKYCNHATFFFFLAPGYTNKQESEVLLSIDAMILVIYL
jgi:hypothetical protein